MGDNSYQARKFLLTINNPEIHGMTHEEIIERIQRFNPDYFCLADEIGISGTEHTHVFVYSESPMRFSTMKNRFPTAHIDKATGSCKSNRDYIRKDGKWAETDKALTKVEGTFAEYGNLPNEADEKSPKMAQLIQWVRDGLTNQEILESDPSYALRTKDIDVLRQELRTAEYIGKNRDVQVHYIFGATGTGKTRSIYEKHPAGDICRITNYATKGHTNFDSYRGEAVLVLEEFHSQIPIADLLNILDIYPLKLPARYYDRVACYIVVYMTSNIPLEEQYTGIQKDKPETWNAFLRRIHTVTEYCKDGTIRDLTPEKGKLCKP